LFRISFSVRLLHCMLSGVGSPVWYYMVLSWLDLVYVLFPFIHFARSLIISVNRRHFNDLCFVFGFSAFFSILFIFHYIWGISGLGVWPFVCHLHAKLRLSLYLFYFHSRYFSSCPIPALISSSSCPLTSLASSSGRLLSVISALSSLISTDVRYHGFHFIDTLLLCAASKDDRRPFLILQILPRP